MLDFLRRGTKSWIAKILFALLIVSFAVWGIGDMVRVGVTNIPAVVAGDVEVSAEEVIADYRRELQRLQRIFGGQFGEEQARQMGLLERTLDNAAARALLDQATNDLDMVVPDDVLRRQIAQNPAFRNQLGQFDPMLFRQAIGAAGYSEDAFLAAARKDLKRGQLLEALTEGIAAPPAMASALYAFRAERRIAETVAIPLEAVPLPPAPPAEELQKYYAANEERFMAPEFRDVATLRLRPADVTEELQISDAEIEEAYAQRQAEFVQPELRTVRQFLFQDEQAAQNAHQLAMEQADLDAVAQELGQPVFDLGTVDRFGLEAIAPALAEAVFALPEGGVTGPVRSPLGWHVAKVTAVETGHERTLDEVRAELLQDIAAERAIDLLYDRANQVEDTLAAGATLEEAADKLGLPLVKATIDARGLDPEGNPVTGKPRSQTFLSTVFTTPQGSETRMTRLENEGGFFLSRVDRVHPPAPRPFEAVQGVILESWQAEQRMAAARARAEDAAKRLQAGEPAEAVAAAVGGTAAVTEPFTRNPQDGATSPQLAAEMFRVDRGGVAVVSEPERAVAARLQQVQPADPQAEAAVVEQLRAQLGSAIESDLVDQLVAGLNARHGARINRQVVEERLR